MKVRKAFTMVEAIIVLAIILVFFSIVVSAIGRYNKSNAQPVARQRIPTPAEVIDAPPQLHNPSSAPVMIEDMRNWIVEVPSTPVDEQQRRMKALVDEIQRLRRKAGE